MSAGPAKTSPRVSGSAWSSLIGWSNDAAGRPPPRFWALTTRSMSVSLAFTTTQEGLDGGSSLGVVFGPLSPPLERTFLHQVIQFQVRVALPGGQEVPDYMMDDGDLPFRKAVSLPGKGG